MDIIRCNAEPFRVFLYNHCPNCLCSGSKLPSQAMAEAATETSATEIDAENVDIDMTESHEHAAPAKLSRAEYLKQIATQLLIVCDQLFKLKIPESITQLIGELVAFREDTELLTWDEIEWIYDNVIPSHFISDKIYTVSPSVDESQSIAFKKYDSYDFHDCVDKQGPTIFLVECLREDGQTAVIGGYCNMSWFSPYKEGRDSKASNGGYYVEGSSDCKLFVVRDPDNAEPMLVIVNNKEKKNMMVAANMDGPNLGFNEFFVTQNGTISAYDGYNPLFSSPKENIGFRALINDGARVVRMEVFKLENNGYYWTNLFLQYKMIGTKEENPISKEEVL